MWVGYNLGCTMGFLMGHSAWQIDQFPTCWPMNGLFVHWSRGWGVSSFSERLVHYVPIMLSSWNFQEWLPMTEVMSMHKVKGRGQKSRLQRSKPNLGIFGPWFHICWWNDAQCLMLLSRGALLISRSSIKFQDHRAKKKNRRFWPKLGVSGLYLQFEFTDG